MMVWASIFLLLCVAAVLGVKMGRVVRSLRENMWRDRIMTLSVVPETDVVGNIGVSMLCLHPSDVRVVEAMLASRYPASEVVVMLDSASELFALLRQRYVLCDVRCDRTTIRALYRSRHKAFRRLVVVDGFVSTKASMLDVAASVSSYDYLLPIPPNFRLLPDAVCRLVVEIASSETPRIDSVSTYTGSLSVVSRDKVAACGGFGPLLRDCKAKNSAHYKARTLSVRHLVALPIEALSERDFFVFSQMRTYNFYDILLFKIMKYRKKFVSLIKP